MATSNPPTEAEELVDVPFVTDVEIENLYGLYSYRLSIAAGEKGETNRLLILYGENGSGKTTVLRLLNSKV